MLSSSLFSSISAGSYFIWSNTLRKSWIPSFCFGAFSLKFFLKFANSSVTLVTLIILYLTKNFLIYCFYTAYLSFLIMHSLCCYSLLSIIFTVLVIIIELRWILLLLLKTWFFWKFLLYFLKNIVWVCVFPCSFLIQSFISFIWKYF